MSEPEAKLGLVARPETRTHLAQWTRGAAFYIARARLREIVPSQMATKLAGYTEHEKAVLKKCRRNALIGGLQWGIPSLLPLWVMFRARLLPPLLAPPCYTAGFVLFSLLGSMSKNNSCIERILEMEDSELANKLRKKLPRQAKLHDKKTRGQLLIPNETESGNDSVSEPASWTTHLESSREGRGRSHYDDDRTGSSSGSEWMQRQDSKGSVRKNKYGDIVVDDDVK